jgi:UDP-glucose-4-epimerase GalE
MENPFKYFQNNVTQGISMLEALTEIGVSNLVFSSSCATNGIPASSMISENHPQSPINPYGESKLLVERILDSLSSLGLMRYASLRYFNASGSDASLHLGEQHDPETHVIPLLVSASLAESEFKVFGTDYETKDGTAVRDFIHVEDLARAHSLALTKLLEGTDSFSVNLGTGVGVSIRDLISGMNQLGMSVAISNENRRPGDPPSLVADSSMAKELLNWEPKVSSIEKILTSEIEWQRRQGAVT